MIDLGTSDKVSFDLYATDYNKTAWDLAENFENTYVSLVKAIRSLAYPKHPATIHSERSAYKMYVPNSVPEQLPKPPLFLAFYISLEVPLTGIKHLALIDFSRKEGTLLAVSGKITANMHV